MNLRNALVRRRCINKIHRQRSLVRIPVSHQTNEPRARDSRTTKTDKRDAHAINAFDVARIRLCATNRFSRTRAKSRDLRRNSDYPISQKCDIFQLLRSWRRERNSNYGYGWPYLFKKSNEFRKLGTRNSCRRADAQVVHRLSCGMRWRPAAERRLFRVRTRE